MNNAGRSAGSANVTAGQVCYNAFSACEDACNSAGMQSSAQMCADLSSKMQTMGNQALNNYDASSAGQNCNAAASSAPMPGGGAATDPNSQLNNQASTDPYGCSTNPTSQACQNCSLNPNSPTCKALAEAQQNPTGKVGFQSPDKSTGGNPNDFNVADNSTAPNGNVFGSGSSDPNAKTDAHVIPNGGGGGIPGDGSSKPATLGSGGGGKPSPGAPGFNNVTDIERGMMAGGYSAPGGSGDTQDSNGYKGYGVKNGRGPASDGAMDLKKYLPGNVMDSRTLAGFGMHSAEISGKSGDNFKKISQRIQEKCKLGILLDCH